MKLPKSSVPTLPDGLMQRAGDFPAVSRLSRLIGSKNILFVSRFLKFFPQDCGQNGGIVLPES